LGASKARGALQAPAHKVTLLNGFSGLSALLRNFFARRAFEAARVLADPRDMGDVTKSALPKRNAHFA
jgi:hypothetical protein